VTTRIQDGLSCDPNDRLAYVGAQLGRWFHSHRYGRSVSLGRFADYSFERDVEWLVELTVEARNRSLRLVEALFRRAG